MNTVYEFAGNLHVHTPYSDGVAPHNEIAAAAADAGLDFAIVTDHNVWVDGLEGYYGDVLLLVGEEIHDVRRQPQSNHLLVYNTNAELAPFASNPQQLIDETNRRGGFCFLAHPFEIGSPIGDDLEPIPWVDWEVTGYTGIEIWNYMSEFKARLRNRLLAIFYAHYPAYAIRGPFRATLRQWDQLLAQGKRVAAIGGSDAHGKTYSMGPLERQLFPYAHLFRCVNTHVITERPLIGRLEHDKHLIHKALQAGHTWVGYDLIAPTRGFRFYARCGSKRVQMGDELVRTGATIFEIQTPHPADIRLIQNGQVVAQARGQFLKHTTADPGVYRVEAYRHHRFTRRGWIFSSPIYVS